MVWITPETQPLVEALRAPHRRKRVQTDTLPSGSTGAINAFAHQRLSQPSIPCLCRDPEHPHGGRIGVVHFTQRREPVDERHAADDSAVDLRNEDLTAATPSGDVTQFSLVGRGRGINERSIRLDGQLTSGLVLGWPHRSNDHRPISSHPQSLLGFALRHYSATHAQASR
jgi:hypothetical protein